MGLHALGDSAWLYKAGGSSPDGKLSLILRLRRLLERNPIPAIVDVVSSFDTIAVHFSPADGQAVLAHLTSLQLDQAGDTTTSATRIFDIPMAYGGKYGPIFRSWRIPRNSRSLKS